VAASAAIMPKKAWLQKVIPARTLSVVRHSERRLYLELWVGYPPADRFSSRSSRLKRRLQARLPAPQSSYSRNQNVGRTPSSAPDPPGPALAASEQADQGVGRGPGGPPHRNRRTLRRNQDGVIPGFAIQTQTASNTSNATRAFRNTARQVPRRAGSRDGVQGRYQLRSMLRLNRFGDRRWAVRRGMLRFDRR
jgi:hypothetical protein